MMVTLKQVRMEWEKGLTPLCVIDTDHTVELVVLEKASERNAARYYCHRYCFGGGTAEWVVSVDGQNVDIDAVFSWLNNPCATATRKIVKPSKVV